MFTSKINISACKICSVNLRRSGEMCARAVYLVITTYIRVYESPLSNNTR
jgi:hypothetical protein